MRDGPIVVIGDALLDVDIHGDCDRLCPDAPVPVIDCSAERDRPGGAALAALSAAWETPGREVVLLTALSDDPAGARIRALLADGVRTCALPLDGDTPKKVRVHARDRSMIRLDFGTGRARHDVTMTSSGEELWEVVAPAGAVLVSDYGRGMAAHPAVRTALEALPASVPIVWDPHPRGPGPLPGVRLLTPNAEEADHLAGNLAPDTPAPRPAPRVTGARAGADAGAAACAGAGLDGAGPEQASPEQASPDPTGPGGAGHLPGSGTAGRTSPGPTAGTAGDATPGPAGGTSGGTAPYPAAGTPADPAEGADLVPAGGAPGGGGIREAASRAGWLARRWGAAGVSVTLGEGGALLSVGDGAPYLVPARDRVDGDPCGAGDRFAATATAALSRGALLPDAVAAGVRGATDFLTSGGVAALSVTTPNGTTPERTPGEPTSGGLPPGEQVRGADDAPPDVLELEDAVRLVRWVRGRGGTVVAAGGCFDILHAGHVDLLRHARELGDQLIVCLNSDASVRRLKGGDRPLVSERDRARVIRAVEGVDAVVVFGEDTPARVLEALRPDLWVKGGDYAGARLPEAAVMRRLGGQTVVLPYLDGRSTSSIVAAARGRE